MIYENLKRARKINNYSCNDMAKILKISSSYYSQIENGRGNLDYVMALKISSIFGSYSDDIFYRYFSKCKILLNKQKPLRVYSKFKNENGKL